MKQRVPAIVCAKLRIACFIALGLLACILAPGLIPATAQASDVASRDREIDRWIDMLGSDQFAQREKANEQLQQLGVAAFEKLHAAQRHPDVEVRKRATYLLRAIRVNWIQEDDPESVKKSFRQYWDGVAEDRLRELIKLGRNPEPRAVSALCRLVRFETSDTLSKLAALEVMERGEHRLSQEGVANIVSEVVGGSQRDGAKWVRAYAKLLTDPVRGREQWNELYAQEVEGVKDAPDKRRLVILKRLMRWYVKQLHTQGGLDKELKEVFAKFLPLHGSTTAELSDTTDWLIDLRAWQLTELMIERHPQQFEEEPQLRYCRAEIAMRQGNLEAADKLVEETKKLPAIDAFTHVTLAYGLQLRGLHDWAEGEYRYVMANEEKGTHGWIEAVFQLGRMFHDQLQNKEAYETYVPLVELMDKDKTVTVRVQELSRVPLSIRGQMYYSKALMLAETGDREGEQQALGTAYKFDGDNADILIAMYHLKEPDENWKSSTRQKIEQLAKKYDNQVTYWQRSGRLRSNGQSQLATAYNQYAWLVSNTFGDRERALRFSLESLELVPEAAGYLDTLARCYFSLGRLEDAIRTQRRAVELEPYTGQIRQQLELFERLAKEAREQPNGDQPNNE